jgi:predicted transcriptional regulator
VVAALALGARTSAEIATAAALDTRVVLKALRRLESVGLV